VTIPLLALVVPLALGAAAAFAALLVSVAEAGVSRLRVSLWRLHDDIVDDLVAGFVVDQRAATRLLHMVRRSIVEAQHLTPLRVFGTHLLYRWSARQRPPQGNRLLRGETRDDLVNAHALRLVDILARGTYDTSVLGHVCKWAAPRSSQERTEAPVRTEVQLDVALHPVVLSHHEIAGVAC
jgi:hypothetical protein